MMNTEAGTYGCGGRSRTPPTSPPAFALRATTRHVGLRVIAAT